MLKIKYFGMVAEAVDKTEEDFIFLEKLDSLATALEKKYDQLKALNYNFAVNQTMVTKDIYLKDNDEIALLPPFAGG